MQRLSAKSDEGSERFGILSYVPVEVDGARNHDCPNRKVNGECKDYLHIIAPFRVRPLLSGTRACTVVTATANPIASARATAAALIASIIAAQ